jgi:N-acetylmuramoyl-L-alanine amidase
VTRRIAIVIGHNAKAQGAVRVTDGVTENAWAAKLAEEIQSINPSEVRVFRRPSTLSTPADIRAAYAEVDAWKADVSCELHLNSHSAPNATGTEIWHASAGGKAVADRVQPQLVAALGLKDRGVKFAARGSRPYNSLTAGKAPAILVESYFASNPADCDRADERFNLLARAIFFGLGGTTEVPEATLEQRVAVLEARCDAAGI